MENYMTIGNKLANNAYESITAMRNYIPSMDMEDYNNVLKSINKLWEGITNRENAISVKNGFRKAKNGNYPVNGMFISATFMDIVPCHGICAPMGEPDREESCIKGLFNDNNGTSWAKCKVGKKYFNKMLPFNYIGYVYNNRVYLYRYFSDPNVRENLKLELDTSYSINEIAKWREDTKTELNKVPAEVIKMIREDNPAHTKYF